MALSLNSDFVKASPPGKKVVIIGATSGIGMELSRYYLSQGCIVGITGRREERLARAKEEFPDNAYTKRMDVRSPERVALLEELISEMGGMDLFIYCAGVGTQNPELDDKIEMEVVDTNTVGFSDMTIYSYNYFKKREKGHITAISSVAGIKALRQSPAYSATKRYEIHYISCLAQKANKEKLPIAFTTIVPGFIRTGMLKYKYPLTVSQQKGARLIYNNIERRKRYSTVPGRWRWIELAWRLIPDTLWEKIW